MIKGVKKMSIKKSWNRAFNKEQYRKDMIADVESYSAPFLKDTLLEKEVFKTEEEYNEAFKEFKRYVGLIAAYDKPLPMLSDKVDEVWHQLILYTKEYEQFCNEKLGYFMHHIPEDTKTNKLAGMGFSRNDFIELYDKEYRKIPEIWGITEKEYNEFKENKKNAAKVKESSSSGLTGSSCGAYISGCGSSSCPSSSCGGSSCGGSSCGGGGCGGGGCGGSC